MPCHPPPSPWCPFIMTIWAHSTFCSPPPPPPTSGLLSPPAPPSPYPSFILIHSAYHGRRVGVHTTLGLLISNCKLFLGQLLGSNTVFYEEILIIFEVFFELFSGKSTVFCENFYELKVPGGPKISKSSHMYAKIKADFFYFIFLMSLKKVTKFWHFSHSFFLIFMDKFMT